MRVSTNDPFIRRRARLGTYAALGGVVVLLIGMIASIWQQYVWVSLGAIIIGFILAQLGNYNLRRFGRAPRPDQVIENSMKGFDDRYHYYAWTLPVPYVLLTPHGVYTFVTRDQTGQISVQGSQWRSKLSLGKVLMFFAQEGLGNPTAEAIEMANRLGSWIKSKLPNLSGNVQPAIVFVDERAQLQVVEPTVPVLDAKGIKKWLRGAGKGENLKSADYKALEELFNAAYATATSKQDI
jgi:hypothetical protein